MKCIGLITGPDSEEGMFYLNELHAEARRHSAYSASAWVISCHITARGLGLREVDRDQSEGEKLVVETARKLHAVGARHLLIGSTAWQSFAGAVAKTLKLPVHEIQRCTVTAVARMRWRCIGILATISVWEERAWTDSFATAGIATRIPAGQDREWICACLARPNELVNCRAQWVRIAADLRHAGAEAVVLCGPAAHRYLREEESPLPIVCAARQQVKVAVEAALV